MSYKEGMSAYGLARRTIFTGVTSSSSYRRDRGRRERGDEEAPRPRVPLLSAEEEISGTFSAPERAPSNPASDDGREDWPERPAGRSPADFIALAANSSSGE